MLIGIFRANMEKYLIMKTEKYLTEKQINLYSIVPHHQWVSLDILSAAKYVFVWGTGGLNMSSNMIKLQRKKTFLCSYQSDRSLLIQEVSKYENINILYLDQIYIFKSDIKLF